MSSIDFVLDRFSAAYTLSQSATMFEGTSLAFTDASATAVFYVSQTDMQNVFKFESDSFDINDLSASDIRYFTYMSNWPAGLVINPVNAMLDKSGSANAITQVGIPNKMLVKHDFIRYLALKLFNTPSGVDLFNNENELIAHLNDMGNSSYQNDISGSLWKYATNASTAIDNTNFILDASSNVKCTTDHLTSNDNICRELFNQILYANKSRFSDISLNTLGVRSLPILTGDSISYRFTVFPKAGQNNITGVAAFGGRSYRIKLLVVADASGENTTVDNTELSTANVTYTKNA
jgi:hypothetical protein